MDKIPNHVALVLDGNRRWARSKGLEALSGHKTAGEAVEVILDHLDARGVQTVTLWGFSTENWKRDSMQVQGLFKIIEGFIDKYHDRAIRDQIKVVHMGRTDRIPQSLLDRLVRIQEETQHFERRTLNLAIDYGGRDEILRAIKRIHELDVDVNSLTEENFNDFLDTVGQPYPEPDLIIRTGGEQRLSGFMPWQSIYAEFYFEKKFLPDMTPEDIDRIFEDYAGRERRFGAGK